MSDTHMLPFASFATKSFDLSMNLPTSVSMDAGSYPSTEKSAPLPITLPLKCTTGHLRFGPGSILYYWEIKFKPLTFPGSGRGAEML